MSQNHGWDLYSNRLQHVMYIYRISQKDHCPGKIAGLNLDLDLKVWGKRQVGGVVVPRKITGLNLDLGLKVWGKKEKSVEKGKLGAWWSLERTPNPKTLRWKSGGKECTGDLSRIIW